MSSEIIESAEPNYLKLITSLLQAIKSLEKALLGLDIVTEKMKNLLPFTEKKKSRVLRALNGWWLGSWYNSTTRNVRAIIENKTKIEKILLQLDHNVPDYQKNKDSPFTNILAICLGKRIKGTEIQIGEITIKGKEFAVYIAEIIKQLSPGSKLRLGRILEIREKDILDLAYSITSLFLIVKHLKVLAERLEENFEASDFEGDAF